MSDDTVDEELVEKANNVVLLRIWDESISLGSDKVCDNCARSDSGHYFKDGKYWLCWKCEERKIYLMLKLNSQFLILNSQFRRNFRSGGSSGV